MKQQLSLKTLCLLLALCLMPLPGAVGEAKAPLTLFGGALIDRQESVVSVAVLDGAAYLLSSNAIYIYAPGDMDPLRLADAPQPSTLQTKPAISHLLAHAGRLKGFNALTGEVYALEIKPEGLSFERLLVLPGEQGEPWQAMSVRRVVVLGDLLLVQIEDWDDKPRQLYGFDLLTGTRLNYATKHLQGLVPFQGDKLIGIYLDDKASLQVPGMLAVFDPASDSVVELGWPLPEDPRQDLHRELKLYWDATTEALYGATLTGLYRLSAEREPLLCARLPMLTGRGGMTGSPAIHPLGEGHVLIAFVQEVFLRGIDPAGLGLVTRLYASGGFPNSAAMTKALMSLDDIELTIYQGEYLDATAINTQLLTGEMPFDLLMLQSDEHDIQRMTHKGYLRDLSGDPDLSAFAGDSLPAFAPLIHAQEGLYAIPIMLSTIYLNAYAQTVEEIAVPLPASIPQMLEFVRWWAREGYQANAVLDEGSITWLLKYMILNSFMDHQAATGQALTFGMQPFGELMQAVDALDLAEFESGDGREDADTANSAINIGAAALLIGYMLYSTDHPWEDSDVARLLPMSLDGTAPAWQAGTGQFVAIPATSKAPEAAERLIVAYIEALSPQIRAGLSRSWQTPVENPRYEERLARYQQMLDQYAAAAAKAEGAQQRELEDQQASLRDLMADYERKERYLLTAEQLHDHQARMALVYLPDSLHMLQRQALFDGVQALFDLYLGGALSLDQFMQQANERIRLMTLEAQ